VFGYSDSAAIRHPFGWRFGSVLAQSVGHAGNEAGRAGNRRLGMVRSIEQEATRESFAHDGSALDCLIAEGAFFGEFTDRLLREAGLRPGMRVLNIGADNGDVAFLAARIVGRRGAVAGVDSAPENVRLATERATRAGLRNVHFQLADIAAFVPDGRYDALIGRRTLLFLPEPAAVVRRLAAALPREGIVAFQEFDITGATSEPHCAVFELTVERIRRTFANIGADIRAGLRLRRVFLDAGLPEPHMHLDARVHGGPDAAIYAQATGVARMLLPLMESTGVATAAEVGIDTLEQRMRSEALALDATLVSPVMIGAWTRTQEHRPAD
jgi:2-polyprenyl-3-methyl-5-hydroxy-6-metoxy-1,4-benzoquinol methylase